MKTELILMNIMAEVTRAESIHPAWPCDPVKAAALCAEECGELVRACNDYDESRGSKKPMVTEAIHTAATAIRFLKEIELDNARNESLNYNNMKGNENE